MSNLPIEIHSLPSFSGKKSNTIDLFFSFKFEDRTPSGLFSKITLRSDLVLEMTLPS